MRRRGRMRGRLERKGKPVTFTKVSMKRSEYSGIPSIEGVKITEAVDSRLANNTTPE